VILSLQENLRLKRNLKKVHPREPIYEPVTGWGFRCSFQKHPGCFRSKVEITTISAYHGRNINMHYLHRLAPFLILIKEKMKKKYITAGEFDEKFDTGEDISEYLDIDNARRPELEQKKVSVNLPSWMVDRLDHEAKKMGITRQSVIKIWIAEKLKKAVL
jgi:hypothetical protein